MDTLKISEIVQAVNGTLINCNNDILISGMTSHIAYVQKGLLYIPYVWSAPVPGFNDLIETACTKGAAAVVVSKQLTANIPQIIVKNNAAAYIKFCKYYRSRFNIPVVGITGSAGKTSTKDMLSLVLGGHGKVCSTNANGNDMPGTIGTAFKINSTHKAAVFELGFTGSYDYIRKMTDIARPNIGIITNISTGHCGLIGSKENIMKAKMEIASYFDKDCKLIINNDDEYLSKIDNKPYSIIRVSTQGNGDYNACDIVDNGEKGVEFKCALDGTVHSFKINSPGVHFVYSSLFCIAVGRLLGIDIEQIKKGIAAFRPYKLRMNVVTLKGNVKIINDCYNANLLSMEAAVNTLKSFGGDRRIAVLGDISEQGKFSEESHRQLGKYIRDKCDMLIAVGTDSRYIYEEAKDYMEAKYFQTRPEAWTYLKSILKPNDVILMKASRAMHLEEIASHLIKDAEI